MRHFLPVLVLSPATAVAQLDTGTARADGSVQSMGEAAIVQVNDKRW